MISEKMMVPEIFAGVGIEAVIVKIKMVSRNETNDSDVVIPMVLNDQFRFL